MRELIEKWAALEPERVHIGPPLSDIGADVRLGGLPLWMPFGAPSAEASAFVLAATIEAITARGWHYTLQGNPTGSWAVVNPDPRIATRHAADGSTPSEALLAAYLAALEAS